jgi:hypothetical protein
MSSSSPRRSSSKGLILRLVGVLAFVACFHNTMTRYSKGSTNDDELQLQRTLVGAPLWGSFWGFGGVVPEVNASNEQAKSLTLDTSFMGFKQDISLEPKHQALLLAFTSGTPPPKLTLMSLPTSNEATTSIAQEESLEVAPQTILPIAVTTGNGQEEIANLSAESTTSNEQGESSESASQTIRCSPPARPPPMPGKRGVCFTLREEGMLGSWVENLPKVIALNPYWNYSWGAKRIAAQPENIEFIPMIWGAWGSEGLEQRIATDILPQIESGQAKRLLGFNEPDFVKQSNLAVDKALSYWPILEQTGLPLASPSAGHATGPWMVEFMQKTEESCLRMEYIAVHWYGSPSAAAFKRKMREAYTLYGSWRPMLITEFAVADWGATTPEENRYSTAQVLAFMKEVLPWMEEQEQDWIAGYSWFSFFASSPAGTSSALFGDDGNLNALGRYYASVTNENPTGDQSI